MGFTAVIAMTMNITFVWDVMLCRFVMLRKLRKKTAASLFCAKDENSIFLHKVFSELKFKPY